MTRFERDALPPQNGKRLSIRVRCANADCPEWVERMLYTPGRPKLYCSPKCAGTASRKRGQQPSQAFWSSFGA